MPLLIYNVMLLLLIGVSKRIGVLSEALLNLVHRVPSKGLSMDDFDDEMDLMPPLECQKSKIRYNKENGIRLLFEGLQWFQFMAITFSTPKMPW